MPPAAQATLNQEQGLEGAAQGLRGWLSAQVNRRRTEAPANRASSETDAEAEAVARQALVSYPDTVPTGLATWLAEWIEQHIAAARGGEGRARWNWELAMLAWFCEECGLPGLLQRMPAAAEDLLAEAGFAARALRQAPSTGWVRGIDGCQPGLFSQGQTPATGTPDTLGG